MKLEWFLLRASWYESRWGFLLLKPYCRSSFHSNENSQFHSEIWNLAWSVRRLGVVFVSAT